MRKNQILGVVLCAVSVAIFVVAYRSTNAMEELSDMLSGPYSDETIVYMVVVISALVGGAFTKVFGTRT